MTVGWEVVGGIGRKERWARLHFICGTAPWNAGVRRERDGRGVASCFLWDGRTGYGGPPGHHSSSSSGTPPIKNLVDHVERYFREELWPGTVRKNWAAFGSRHVGAFDNLARCVAVLESLRTSSSEVRSIQRTS